MAYLSILRGDKKMVHAVKIEPEYFMVYASGRKPFEVRKNDRPYKVGDFLALNEYNRPGNQEKSPAKPSGLTSETYPTLIRQGTSVANGSERTETRRFRMTLCRGRILPLSGCGMIRGFTKLAGYCWTVTHGKSSVWMMCANCTVGWKSS